MSSESGVPPSPLEARQIIIDADCSGPHDGRVGVFRGGNCIDLVDKAEKFGRRESVPYPDALSAIAAEAVRSVCEICVVRDWANEG
jgi:hypothetical protein